MDYLVLARKWRPQVFEDVVGQDHVVRTLQNAIGQDRVAHAFIFSGPRGVGKTSVARILAKALNCAQGPGPVPCQVCTNCREITAGTAMDVREIDGASNRGIDEIRELREHIKFAPVTSRYTIYIIDEVHMLTREAFNALLKTLEEPPAHVIFIFATTETHKVPVTILSRCQCFDFRRISLRQIRDKLGQIAEAEHIRISETGLAWIAEAGDGSLRDAQSVLDQVVSYAGFDINDRDIEEILGRSDRRFLFQLSEAVLAREAGRCLRIVDEGYYAGLDMKYFFQMLLAHFRNLLLAKIAGDEPLLRDLADDESAKLRDQAAGASRDTLQRLLDMVMAEEENVRRSGNPRLNLEVLLVRMAYLEPLLPLDEFVTRMEAIEKRLAPAARNTHAGEDRVYETAQEQALPYHKAGRNPAGSAEAQATASPEEVQATASPDKAQPDSAPPAAPDDAWENFTAFVRVKRPSLGSVLAQGRIAAHGEGSLTIAIPQNLLGIVDVKDLVAMGVEFFGAGTAVRFVPAEEEPGEMRGKNGNNRHSRVQEIKAEALNHPLLQKVLDIFPEAEVREVTMIRDQ
jgi:DNA polymerase III subunit gamma/tau